VIHDPACARDTDRVAAPPESTTPERLAHDELAALDENIRRAEERLAGTQPRMVDRFSGLAELHARER
jgi:hypothetical protein